MTTHECRDRARMLGTYLDGELEASKLLDIDEHVAVCEGCREEVQLLRAMRGSLKRVVRSAAPVGLRERIGNAMTGERIREEARTAEGEANASRFPPTVLGPSAWRTSVPLAVAAGIALMWGTATRAFQSPANEVHAGFGDDLLAELVAEHSQPLPPEATNAQAVRGLERWVGVPVRPGSFERAGARLVGGRVVPFRSQRAAMLQYVLGSGEDTRRVSVFVYDAQKIQGGTANLAPRSVGAAEIRVGREKGYSVAATQRAGEGYLVASDLDPDETAQLAAMVYDDR
ncbi:MAG TPA: zf-HC2 domain-containing protein [Polyangiaceae bacterium]|nr:zf-HC2 domain-containing protein [Polyangiaceae bacterium]